jgi:hypothetical protein
MRLITCAVTVRRSGVLETDGLEVFFFDFDDVLA